MDRLGIHPHVHFLGADSYNSKIINYFVELFVRGYVK